MATGDVIFVPPAIHRTFCPINFAEWPWGQQNCNLTFGSWTYHQGNVDIVPYESSSFDMEAIDTKYFVNPRVCIAFIFMHIVTLCNKKIIEKWQQFCISYSTSKKIKAVFQGLFESNYHMSTKTHECSSRCGIGELKDGRLKHRGLA